MENRNGPVADGLASRATRAGGMPCGRDHGDAPGEPRPDRDTGSGQGLRQSDYDTAAFVATCKALAVEAHVARNTSGRRSTIDEALAASAGYRASRAHRKRIEVFGWVKTVARFSKTRHRGLARVDWQVALALAAYDLIRLPKLLRPAA